MNAAYALRSSVMSVILMSSLCISACTELQAQSRVDPQSIAAYQEIDRRAPERQAPRNPAQPNPAPAKQPQADTCVSHKLKYDTRSGSIDLDCFIFPRDPSDKTAYQEALDDQTGETRNRLGFVLIKQSDDICTIEEGRLVADEATVNTALSTLDSIFSATSTVVTGQQAKSIFSGLATVANASRGHVNAEIYRNALTPSITKAIDGARDSRRSIIITSFSKGLKDYPVEQMIVDVNEYHQICSFYKGLSLVELAVDKTTVTDSDRLDAIRSSIALLDSRLADLRKQLKVTGISQADTDTINKQISDLTTQQTNLFTQMTNLQTVTGKPAPASTTPTGTAN